MEGLLPLCFWKRDEVFFGRSKDFGLKTPLPPRIWRKERWADTRSFSYSLTCDLAEVRRRAEEGSVVLPSAAWQLRGVPSFCDATRSSVQEVHLIPLEWRSSDSR